MLDVHPPHAPTHTWKDFFIHVGTICVGLLIAVGLEQTVEALHHHRQLAEVREALERDNEKALRDDKMWERYMALERAWLTACLDDAGQALRTNTTPHFIPEPEAAVQISELIVSLPVDPTWKAARASNLIEVMPQDEVKAFAEIDVMIERVSFVQRDEGNARRLQGFEAQFRTPGHGDVLDFSRATRADVVAYVAILGEQQFQADSGYRYSRYLRGALQAVLRGERDLDKIDDEENKVRDGAALTAAN